MVTVVNRNLRTFALFLMLAGVWGLGFFAYLYLPVLSSALKGSFDATYGTMQQSGWWEALHATTPSMFLSLCYVQDRLECRASFKEIHKASWESNFLVVWQTIPWRRWQLWGYPALFLVGLLLLFLSKTQRPLYSARFAGLHELKRLFIKPKRGFSIPLGVLHGRWLGLTADFNRNQDLAHLLAIAPTRAGKSAHLMGVLLSWKLPVIVVDMKGELRERTGGFRTLLGEVYTLNPEKPQTSHRFDPIAVWLEQIPNAAPDIARFLLHDPDDREPFFSGQASYPLLAAIRSAVLLKKSVLKHLNDLLFLGVQGFVRQLHAHNDGEIERHLSGFLGMTSDEFLMLPHLDTKGPVFSVWQTLLQKLQPLMRPEVLELMGEDEIALEDLTDLSTLYIQWPEHLLDADAKPLALLLHVIVTCLCNKADREGGRLPYPTLLALDEITRYQVPALPQYISTMLGRGMAALLYAQSFSQLVHTYGEAQATVIEDNCGVEMYYRPQSDTSEKLEKELGQVSLPSERVSRRLKDHERTVSQGEQSRPLMTREEIRRLQDDQTLILSDSHRAILAKRINPFKVRWLKGRLDLPLLELEHREVVEVPELRQEVSPTAFFDFDEAELG